MNKADTLFTRKRRMATKRTSMTPPALGVSLGVALLISTAQSFSVLHQGLNSPGERISSGILHRNDASTSQATAYTENTSVKARLGRTSLPYLNYDLDFSISETVDLDPNDETVFAPSWNTQPPRQKLPSLEVDGWEDLNEVMDSPSGFPLNWSIYVPKGVSASFFSTGKNQKSSPLVLTPDRKNRRLGAAASSEFLRSFLKTNQKWVDESILDHGGIVFRGFGGTEFDPNQNLAIGKEILRAFGSGNTNEGTRKGFEYYLVSNDESKVQSLSSMGHHVGRSSLKGLQPLRLSEISTQTRITDWRKIYNDLPTNLRRKLDDKNLLYKRIVVEKNAAPTTLISLRESSSNDTTEHTATPVTEVPSSWFCLFGSTNKRVLQTTYRKLIDKLPYRFKETELECEAFRRHPLTKERIWFEFAHRFHWTSLPAELMSEFKRTKNPLTLARSVMETSIGLWKRLRWKNYPMSLSRRQPQESEITIVAFGDGTHLNMWEMHQIRKAINQNTAQYPWKTGDILVVDGLSFGVQQ